MKMTVLDLPVSDPRDGAARAGPRDREGDALRRRRGVLATAAQHAVMDEDWGVTTGDAASQGQGLGPARHQRQRQPLRRVRRARRARDGGRSGARRRTSRCSATAAAAARARPWRSTTASWPADLHPELPHELGHLAWLDLASDAGEEYWAAMELMGAYAAANHELIHRHVAARARRRRAARHREPPQLRLARASRAGRRLRARRRSCTARAPRRRALGVLGIIPGSMAAPGYVVRGKGDAGVASTRRRTAPAGG